MGLLDDAIREHLDLKRRRGADPGEIERAEREALGPVRRGADPMTAEAVADDPGLYDAQSEEPWGEEYEDQDYLEDEEYEEEPALSEGSVFERDHELDDDDLLEDEPFPEPRAGSGNRPVLYDDEAQDDDVPPPPAAARREIPEGGDETQEWHVSEGAEDDDVLEETPEFLQDTPDHDRLWFEQKPPRDFDFGN